MKKIATIFFVLLLLLIGSVNVFAAEYDDVNNTANLTVTAKYNYYSNSNIYTANDSDNGSYLIDTQNGIKVSVESPKQEDLLLVVHIIKEQDKEAYQWFLDCTEVHGKKPIIFDIYFVDGDGNRIELNDDVEICVELSDTYSVLKVYALNQQGVLNELDRSIQNGSISFKSTTENYYVILEGKTDTVDSPQTGDNSNIALWMILLFASSSCIMLILHKRKSHT